jgi:quinol monooxygenase YgiN
MIVVTGKIIVSDRDRFLASSEEAMRLAREAKGCLDFVVAADPLEPDRVNVLERWTDRTALLAFRGDGPGDDLRSLIREAEVKEYEVAEPPPSRGE